MAEQGSADPHSRRVDVSASEAASYVFCAKAWHLEHVLGAAPSEAGVERRAVGVEAHAAHGAGIRSAHRMSTWLVRGLVTVLVLALAVLVFGLLMSSR
jgi:hypothetical protein